LGTARFSVLGQILITKRRSTHILDSLPTVDYIYRGDNQLHMHPERIRRMVSQ